MWTLSFRILLWMTALGVLLPSSVSWAELYMYRDKDGVVHFTDELDKVPPHQRPGVKELPATPPDAPPTAEPEEAERKTDEKQEVVQPEAPPEEKTEDKAKDPAKLEILKEKKDALDQERARLEAKQDELMTKVQKMRIEGKIRVINRELMDVHAQLLQHHGKREAFEAKWEAYHDPSKDSPDHEELRASKASLETERSRINQELAPVLDRGKSVRTNYAGRAYKTKIGELQQQIHDFQRQRDIFERKRDGFYTSQ